MAAGLVVFRRPHLVVLHAKIVMALEQCLCACMCVITRHDGKRQLLTTCCGTRGVLHTPTQQHNASLSRFVFLDTRTHQHICRRCAHIRGMNMDAVKYLLQDTSLTATVCGQCQPVRHIPLTDLQAAQCIAGKVYQAAHPVAALVERCCHSTDVTSVFRPTCRARMVSMYSCKKQRPLADSAGRATLIPVHISIHASTLSSRSGRTCTSVHKFPHVTELSLAQPSNWLVGPPW